MIIFFIYLSLSIVGSGLIFYFNKLYSNWYNFYLPIVFFLAIYLALLVVTILGLLLASLFLSKKKSINKPHRMTYFWVKQIVFLLVTHSNTKVTYTNKELLPPKNERFLVICNHVSKFDQMVIIKNFNRDPMCCITKPENLNIPICGPFIHHSAFFDIDRNNDFNAMKTIIKASKLISDGIANICISPEGTRNKTNELLPFHAGSFKIATKAKCPIVIVSVKNTNLIHKNFPFRRTHVYLDILECLYPQDYQDKNTQYLADYSADLIRNNLLKRGNN